MSSTSRRQMGKPEPAARGGVGARVAELREVVEDVLEALRGHADAGVLDADEHGLVRGQSRGDASPAGRGEFDGVGHEVAEHTGELDPVGPGPSRGPAGGSAAQRQVPGLGQGEQPRPALLGQQFVQGELGLVEPDPGREVEGGVGRRGRRETRSARPSASAWTRWARRGTLGGQGRVGGGAADQLSEAGADRVQGRPKVVGRPTPAAASAAAGLLGRPGGGGPTPSFCRADLPADSGTAPGWPRRAARSCAAGAPACSSSFSRASVQAWSSPADEQ